MKNSMKTVARIGQIGISSVHEVKQRPEIHKFKPEFSALPRDNQLCFMIFNLFQSIPECIFDFKLQIPSHNSVRGYKRSLGISMFRRARI